MKTKFTSIIILLTSSLLFANEVSVFGAGNLNSKKPYGLSSTEKYILKNKNDLDEIDTKFKNIKAMLNSLIQRVDGIDSIYESDSKRLNSVALKVDKFIKNLQETINTTTKNTEEIEKLKSVVSQLMTMEQEISNENKKNLDALKEAIGKLVKQVNVISKKYVSIDEVKSNFKQFVTLKEFKAFKEKLVSEIKTKTNSSTDSKKLSYVDKNKMLEKAKDLFKQEYFTKAIPIFEELVKLNYKPAESNYYLGEMWYYRNKYEKAIRYFKKSAVLYDKASWMPTLLLHSAISFEKIKDFENATKFYSTLIELYPSSKEAKMATKNKK